MLYYLKNVKLVMVKLDTRLLYKAAYRLSTGASQLYE